MELKIDHKESANTSKYIGGKKVSIATFHNSFDLYR